MYFKILLSNRKTGEVKTFDSAVSFEIKDKELYFAAGGHEYMFELTEWTFKLVF